MHTGQIDTHRTAGLCRRAIQAGGCLQPTVQSVIGVDQRQCVGRNITQFRGKVQIRRHAAVHVEGRLPPRQAQPADRERVAEREMRRPSQPEHFLPPGSLEGRQFQFALHCIQNEGGRQSGGRAADTRQLGLQPRGQRLGGTGRVDA